MASCFGYEEALGFAVDPLVADKDGVSAALALAKLAHELSKEGRSLLARIDEVESQFGVHATSQLSIRAGGPEFADLPPRGAVSLYEVPPATLGDLRVTEVFDLERGVSRASPTEGAWFTLGELRAGGRATLGH